MSPEIDQPLDSPSSATTDLKFLAASDNSSTAFFIWPVYLLPGGRVSKAPGKYPGINFAAFSAPISFESWE